MQMWQTWLNARIKNAFLCYVNPYSANTQQKPAPQIKRWVAGFPPRQRGFEPGSGQVGFVVDKVALEQVFSEYFGFPYQSSFYQILHSHNHGGKYNMPDEPSGLSLDSNPTMLI
jgi:hypothetical protein